MAALLLWLTWQGLRNQSSWPAPILGVEGEPNRGDAVQQFPVDRIHDGLSETRRGPWRSNREEATQAVDTEAVPAGWTLRFSVDRSRLRPPAVHVADVERRRSSYYATVFLASGKSIEFGRNELPASSQVEVSFRHSDFEPLLQGASFVLATCPQGVGETKDVFFVGLHGRSGILLRDAVSIDTEARVVELGQQVLEPVPYLGAVTVQAREDGESFDAFISSTLLGKGLLGQFGRPTPGRLKSFSQAGGRVEVYSFGPGSQWSVLFNDSQGELITREEAARGEDITIEYERPRGVSVAVDLERYADVSRILFVAGDVPLAQTLDQGAYEARVKAALSTNAVPMPRFRSVGAPYTTGATLLDDGDVRVELWARRLEGSVSEWELLHSRSVTVAGDMVELSF